MGASGPRGCPSGGTHWVLEAWCQLSLAALGAAHPRRCNKLCRARPGGLACVRGRDGGAACASVRVCVCVQDISGSRVKLDLPAVGSEERKKIEVLFLNRFFPLFFFFSLPAPPARAAAAWQ